MTKRNFKGINKEELDGILWQLSFASKEQLEEVKLRIEKRLIEKAKMRSKFERTVKWPAK